MPLLLVDRAGPVALQQPSRPFAQPTPAAAAGALQLRAADDASRGMSAPPGGWGARSNPGDSGTGGVWGGWAGGESAAGRGGWGGGAEEALAFKWHALLQAAAAALVPNLAMARAESPAVVQVRVRAGVTCPRGALLCVPARARAVCAHTCARLPLCVMLRAMLSV